MEYRPQIVKSLRTLLVSREHLFTDVLNIATAGEMRHIMDAFEEGDVYDFQLSHVEDLKDPNVKKLVHLIQEIDHVLEEIKTSNHIEDKEFCLDEGSMNGLN
ncbi:hypothetical protein PQ465_14115 [Sphingobacterium oryzagri]|uniref:Uncharacterized protein n=1 Tax=Sphingobacterium oryzagri TaxID=3025669 RepID=A0ABY7WG20_9SPHI|nr:hypothetical protein [Sphingobacterium sp. KACC 22765]WDF67437.1 hypothetical protein PQ465_14115 [Sphingobacterium sp. KACC 22765]